ncbi:MULTISPECIES: heme-binding protein [unclassified Bradyrhizobium]|uniref:heme-binding protein n=1 Tax=unclassified Bradyrhizobium TaxID=2631580 RepID=UPI00339A461D
MPELRLSLPASQLLHGGVPIRINGQVVGEVRVAGMSKEADTEMANTATASLGTSRHRIVCHVRSGA